MKFVMREVKIETDNYVVKILVPGPDNTGPQEITTHSAYIKDLLLALEITQIYYDKLETDDALLREE